MSRTQQRTTDLMFVVGLSTAPISCGAQILRTFSSTEGVSLAHYIAFALSFVIGLVLALDSRRENPGRIITQQIYLFGLWSMGGFAIIATLLLRTQYHWLRIDSVIATLATAGIVGTFVWALVKGIGFKDPAIKAWTSIFLKSIPQFLLGWNIFLHGGAGISVVLIVVGHISIMMRLVPLDISARTEGLDRNKYWLIVGEVLNSISWLTATAVWVWKQAS